MPLAPQGGLGDLANALGGALRLRPGGGLRWKSLAQVRNETAQVKGKAERVAAKRRAKQARA